MSPAVAGCDPTTLDLMTLDEAVARVSRGKPVAGTELVPLVAAAARVLAEDLVSPLRVPPFDNSAMDGFAFRFADLPAGRRLEVTARAAAGHPVPVDLPVGGAARIFTGAAMPGGADTVALQEHCAFDGQFVVLPDRLEAGANRRLAGEDVAAGEVVLRSGTRMRPQDVGMAAAVGRAMLRVRRRVRVAVLSTGDELRAPGTALPPGAIHDSNRPAILAALIGLGAEVTDLGAAADDGDAVRAMLAAAASGHDLVIASGGVSVGEEDHVKQAVTELGRLDLWRLALKPGKPIAVGEVAGVPFVGLPGNPVAALVTFWLIARPLLLRLQGAREVAARRFTVTAGFGKRHAPGRREFLRVRLRPDASGPPVAELFPKGGSGVLSSLVWSDGLAEIGEDRGHVLPGDTLSFIPYEALLS